MKKFAIYSGISIRHSACTIVNGFLRRRFGVYAFVTDGVSVYSRGRLEISKLSVELVLLFIPPQRVCIGVILMSARAYVCVCVSMHA